MAATMALEMIGPMPGTLISRFPASSVLPGQEGNLIG